MDTVTRIYSSNIAQGAPSIETGISREALDAENVEYESFAALVWETCERDGWYNDSDPSSGVLCLYVKGEDLSEQELTDLEGKRQAEVINMDPALQDASEELDRLLAENEGELPPGKRGLNLTRIEVLRRQLVDAGVGLWA